MSDKNYNCKLNNSVIGSWEAYVYQGLCGLYHSIRLIGKNCNRCVDYKLFLDSYEDFAIMNDEGKFVSLHQCKDEKCKTDYADEYRKMRAKRTKLKSHDLCSVESCSQLMKMSMLPC